MLKQIIGCVSLFLVVNQVSAMELDQVRSLEVTTSLQFRAYAAANQSATDATAFNQKSGYPSCQLSYLPNAKKMDAKLFKVVGTEPKYDGGRVDLFSLNKNLELTILKMDSQVSEKAQECALPSHPEMCDSNPPMVKSKSTDIEMRDAKGDRWFLLCMSDEIESAKGVQPTISTEDVLKVFGPLKLK